MRGSNRVLEEQLQQVRAFPLHVWHHWDGLADSSADPHPSLPRLPSHGLLPDPPRPPALRGCVRACYLQPLCFRGDRSVLFRRHWEVRFRGPDEFADSLSLRGLLPRDEHHFPVDGGGLMVVSALHVNGIPGRAVPTGVRGAADHHVVHLRVARRQQPLRRRHHRELRGVGNDFEHFQAWQYLCASLPHQELIHWDIPAHDRGHRREP
mmetsp:Transcript_53438/g.127134  ORF Transcript_53438/g.127134 Transcript_53438/m.127134 type:complete len:208 (-) Transcript_53438:3622-4245(-)